jgi:arginine deiminase
MKVFNENQLKKLIKDYVKEEYKSYRTELDKIWNYLNKLREEIRAVENLISSINNTEKIEV